jgi:hypothetical protein
MPKLHFSFSAFSGMPDCQFEQSFGAKHTSSQLEINTPKIAED